jgi:transposase-like protein
MVANVEEMSGTKRSRRRWTIEEKLAIVEAPKRCGDPVSVVARRYGMNANHLFNWLQRDRDGTLDRRGSVSLTFFTNITPFPTQTSSRPHSLIPRLKGVGAKPAKGASGDQMRLEVEGVVDGGMRGPKAPARPLRLELPHLPLPSPDRQVRVLRAVVGSHAAGPVAIGRVQSPGGAAV